MDSDNLTKKLKKEIFFDKQIKGVIRVNKPQSKHWHKKDVERRVILNVIFFVIYLTIFIHHCL